MLRVFASLVLAAAVLAPAAAAEPLRISTLSLTNESFLRGVADGKPVTITGELEFPARADGPAPVVVLLHGAGGLEGFHATWAREIRSVGFATLLLDSFSGRSAAKIMDQMEAVSLPSRVVDAYRALAALAAHPKIDRARIVYMGFSHGAAAGIPASQRRFAKAFGTPDAEFAGWLLFYPFCNVRFNGDEQVVARPMRIFHGAADDWTPIATCRGSVERLRAAGADVVLHEYPDAYHTFDNPRHGSMNRQPNAMNPARCFYEERAGFVMVNVDTGKEMSFRDPCWTRGVTTGYSPAAHAASTAAVKDFLTKLAR
jgi:dienelactone hydrolase